MFVIDLEHTWIKDSLCRKRLRPFYFKSSKYQPESFCSLHFKYALTGADAEKRGRWEGARAISGAAPPALIMDTLIM